MLGESVARWLRTQDQEAGVREAAIHALGQVCQEVQATHAVRPPLELPVPPGRPANFQGVGNTRTKHSRAPAGECRGPSGRQTGEGKGQGMGIPWVARPP